MRLNTSYPKKANKWHLGAGTGHRLLLAPVFRCCACCDELFPASPRNKRICSDICRKNRFDRRQRKKIKNPRCLCGKYAIKSLRYIHCSQACREEYRIDKFRVTMPNGQVFDNSKRKNAYIPKPVAVSCIDCGCFRYWLEDSGFDKPTRCIRCNAIHGSKIQAAKKTEKYAKLYAKGYVPSKDRSDNHKQRAIMFNVEYDHSVTIGAVIDKYSNECQECGITLQKHAGGWHPEGWTIGHIIPMSIGGPHTWDNVQAECHACNMWKGNRELEVDWVALTKN